MIGKIAEFIANKKLNISDMVNKSRDDIAINLIDLDSEPPKELIESLKKIEHVLSVRGAKTAFFNLKHQIKIFLIRNICLYLPTRYAFKNMSLFNSN